MLKKNLTSIFFALVEKENKDLINKITKLDSQPISFQMRE